MLRAALLPCLLLSTPSVSTAAARGHGDNCARACDKCLQPVRFNDSLPTDPAAVHLCRSRLALSSRHLCLQNYCGPEAAGLALGAWNATCSELVGSPLPPLLVNHSREALARLPRIHKGDALGADGPLVEAVIPSAGFFRAWAETLDSVDFVKRHHSLYALATGLFWAGVVLIGFVHKLCLAFSRMRRGRHQRRPPSTPRLVDAGRRWFQRNVTIPAAFGYRCAEAVWWASIPPRMQAMTIAVFLLMNLFFGVHGYMIVSENMYLPSWEQQVLRYASDRMGIMAFANFPLIWLFGMRNNVAIWLTGWSAQTYNHFHRWVARAATLQALVHAFGYTAFILRSHGWKSLLWLYSTLFFSAGQVAAVLMCALVACSFCWIRRRHYETFLVLHIGMSVLLLVAMLGHVSIFHGRLNSLFWIPVYIWVLDRSIRLLRLIAFNPLRIYADAYASFSAETNIVRLNVSIGKGTYKVRPGTYYYLTLLEDAHFWESHPFSVASVSSHSLKSTDELSPLLTAERPRRLEAGDGSGPGRRGRGGKQMTFLIRPYNGFTKRLKRLASDEPSSPVRLRVFVEGPYGHTTALDRYDRVVFLAGGSGVSVFLSYQRLLAGSGSAVQLHWAVREPAFATEVLATDMDEDWIGREDFSVDLYVPASMPATDAADGRPRAGVRHHATRLDVDTVVQTAVAAAGRGQRLCVVACGPSSIKDETRAAVVAALRGAECRLDFVEESW
ncbi:hypothetical protein CDD83_6942 [Cordyceps sp. RAO-2017]|nr:hypothetical protein CDD83_6942 [Cordyceps sp. RAO-2017]